MAEFIQSFLHALDQLPFGWLVTSVTVFMAIETSLLVGLFVPGDTVVLAAGAATSNAQEAIILGFFSALGTLAGQSGGYFIGRKVGASIRTSRLKRWITEEHWVRAEALLRRGAGPGILAAQFTPFVHATLPVVAGITGLEYRRFALWAGIGSTLWAIVYITAGALFGQVARANPSRIGIIAFCAVAIIAGLWLLSYSVNRWVLKRLRAKKLQKNL